MKKEFEVPIFILPEASIVSFPVPIFHFFFPIIFRTVLVFCSLEFLQKLYFPSFPPPPPPPPPFPFFPFFFPLLFRSLFFFCPLGFFQKFFFSSFPPPPPPLFFFSISSSSS